MLQRMGISSRSGMWVEKHFCGALKRLIPESVLCCALADLQVENIVVTYLRPEHPHNSAEFFAHTGLKNYPKYMVGGGYVISDDVARLVVLSNELVRSKCCDRTYLSELSKDLHTGRNLHNPFITTPIQLKSAASATGSYACCQPSYTLAIRR